VPAIETKKRTSFEGFANWMKRKIYELKGVKVLEKL
jgi:hypothetical protein